MDSDMIKCQSVHHWDRTLAVRFCSKCELFICNECIVDYHSDHTNEAKQKIPDLLSNAKFNYGNLLLKAINTEASTSVDASKISRYIDKIEQAYYSNEKEIILAIENLTNLLDEERVLFKTIKSYLEKQTDKCNKSPNYLFIVDKRYELEGLVNKWDSKTNEEKMNLFKQRTAIEANVNNAIYELLNEPDHINEFNKVLDIYTNKNQTEEISKITLSTSYLKTKTEKYKDIIGNNDDTEMIIDKFKLIKIEDDFRINNNIIIPSLKDIIKSKPIIKLPEERDKSKPIIKLPEENYKSKTIILLPEKEDNDKSNSSSICKACIIIAVFLFVSFINLYSEKKK